MNNQTKRGINLGGWLVAERWMTPDIFEGVEGKGERMIGLQLGSEKATERLEQHRKGFITEEDFRWIAEQGFSMVRLPVGYWLFEEDTGFVTGAEYVDRAFEWARKYDVRILLDFHGAQGSQNGNDHSGQEGAIEFYKGNNKDKALATLAHVAERYGDEVALVGIEVINEPHIGVSLGKLLDYYDRAYEAVSQRVKPDVAIIMSDGFQPLRLARALSKRRYGPQLVLDVHLYQVFSDADRKLSWPGHIDKVQKEWAQLLDELSSYQPVLIGEWSAALPWEVLERFSQDDRQSMTTQYYQAQRELFDAVTWGHCYWSYKSPGNGPWNYRGQPEFH